MFNDVGIIAVMRPLPDGTLEPGFKVFFAGGLGANPKAAQALEEFTSREDLMPTIEAVLRTFDHYGNRDNKLRARMKWLVDTMGWEELQARILKERKLLVGSSSSVAATAMGQGTPVTIRSSDPQERWADANVVRGARNGTVSAYAYARL